MSTGITNIFRCEASFRCQIIFLSNVIVMPGSIFFYRMYSELVSSTIAEGGPFASKTSYVKLLR